MSRVELMIGGRDYAVACSPGEEDHVRMLGRIIEEKMDSLPGATNQSEVRSMLFAALLLADELHELRQQVEQSADPAATDRLEAIAARLEQLAASIEDLV
ncbi:cell division protein ZapA [Novosphingobium sp. KACC 22771]|uniref:cell division protein ZapA n=1 Tax=Novosphingobium sp. KACC 22771 TaxID=3025670 RepID=UPI002366D5A8|nr:cell division protein ZapA [Novosphingobium sp. KACC 22771]WDF71541.1 cell division protein ZapA [Novosphingobium sp. KACC 22771]